MTSKVPLAPLGTSPSEPVVFAPSSEPATRKWKNLDDLKFLKVFVGHIDFPKDKFPVLHKRYTKMIQQEGLCLLYDEETCQEFCLAVNLVISGFRERLSELDSHRTALKKGSAKLRLQVYHEINQYGYMLYMLSRGAALRMYLQNVNPLLSDFHRPAPKRVYLFKEKSTDAFDEGVGEEELEVEMEELGAELEDVLETDNKDFEFPAEPDEEFTEKDPHAWQLCLRWIKLLISYFGAASMLIRHLPVKHFPKINVQLLRNSPGNVNLLPWETLLKDPRYFPLQTRDNRDRPNEEIISIIERAISFKPYDHGSQLQAIREDWEEIMKAEPTGIDERYKIAKAFDKRFQEIEATIGIRSCLTYAQGIRNQLTAWKDARSTTSSLILNNIDSMMELCYVFSQIETPHRFTGTVHCEANIANFLSRQDSKVGYLIHVFVSVI